MQPTHWKGNDKGRASIEPWEAPPDLGRKGWSSCSVSPPALTQQPTSITRQTLGNENSSSAALDCANVLIPSPSAVSCGEQQGEMLHQEMLRREDDMWVSQLEARKPHGERL